MRNPRREGNESIGYVGSMNGQRRRSKTKERCYYSTFLLLFTIIILINLLSFSLFLIIDIAEIKDKRINGSIFSSCILFINNSTDWSTGALACDVVLASKLAVLVVTVLIFLAYYPILLCLGAKM